MTLNVADTVGSLVAEKPSRSRVFERFNIDYCCGGKRPLAEICAETSVALDEVVRALEANDEETPQYERDWRCAPFGDLIDHIVETHHAYLKEELPRLEWLSLKVARVHGGQRPELRGVARVFLTLREELIAHMAKEEEALFPAVRAMEGANETADETTLRALETEHAEAGDALERLRSLTDDYAIPAEACNSYRAMLDGLRELDADMRQHIHKENNVLFPRLRMRP